MANLKTDLLNEIRQERYFADTELVRLANNPNISYKEKIEKISTLLGEMALNNTKVELVNALFQEVPVDDKGQSVVEEPQAPIETDPDPIPTPPADNVVVQQGQSHQE